MRRFWYTHARTHARKPLQLDIRELCLEEGVNNFIRLQFHKMLFVFRVADEHAMSVNDRIEWKIENHIKSEREGFRLP